MSQPATLPNPPNPEPTVYHDNAIERVFIGLFSRKIARQIHVKHYKPGYDGFVDLSKKSCGVDRPQNNRPLLAKFCDRSFPLRYCGSSAPPFRRLSLFVS